MTKKPTTPQSSRPTWLDEPAKPEDKKLHRPAIVAYLKSINVANYEDLKVHEVFKGAAKHMCRNSKRWKQLLPEYISTTNCPGRALYDGCANALANVERLIEEVDDAISDYGDSNLKPFYLIVIKKGCSS